MKLSIGAVLLLLNNNVNAFTGVNTDTFRVTRKLVIGNGMMDDDVESAVVRAVSISPNKDEIVETQLIINVCIICIIPRANIYQERQTVHLHNVSEA